MKICVEGLWHLGSVTAACLASLEHDVIGLDNDQAVIDGLNQGKAPLFEPGLDELIQAGQSKGCLRFTSNVMDAVREADVLWVTFDTPVDDDDQADIDFVMNQIKTALLHLVDGTVVLISSQLPVGSIRKLELFVRETMATKRIHFACSPENLRLGKALDVFLKPDRIIVGVRTDDARCILERLLLTITDKIEWMSVESAEMTKHAINAFLATSVTFVNEIASICELVGADAKEVERGLKSEVRIGPKAYLSPGGPFAGGTLARDIEFLGVESRAQQLSTPLLSSIQKSNHEHKHWVRRKLLENLGNLQGVTVAVWGLTYKVGTDTLRRSLAVELCDWLIEQGVIVQVYDPVVQALPERWGSRVVHCAEALDAVIGAAALVLGTEWPQLRQEAEKLLSIATQNLMLIDANRHFQAITFPARFKYVAVGTPALAAII